MLDIRKLVLVSCLFVVIACPKTAPYQATTPSSPATHEKTDSVKKQDKTSIKEESYWDIATRPEYLSAWAAAAATLLAGVAALIGLRAVYNKLSTGVSLRKLPTPPERWLRTPLIDKSGPTSKSRLQNL